MNLGLANDGEPSYSAFRLVEKHFKNRSNPLKYPSLRRHNVVDLSRPEAREDDEVYNAGWWSPENDMDKVRRSKGKERAKGERPENDLSQLSMIQLEDGKIGWVVAPG